MVWFFVWLEMGVIGGNLEGREGWLLLEIMFRSMRKKKDMVVDFCLIGLGFIIEVRLFLI